jgi:hypothetical protein
MARAARIGFSLLLLAQNLAADDWPGPRVMTVFSEGGGRFVRVTPGESLGDSVGFAGAKRGAYAHILVYERQSDRSYRLTGETALLNPVAPVELLLSDTG